MGEGKKTRVAFLIVLLVQFREGGWYRPLMMLVWFIMWESFVLFLVLMELYQDEMLKSDEVLTGFLFPVAHYTWPSSTSRPV